MTTESCKPKPRRTGQCQTIVAGKKYVLRVFLSRDAAKKSKGAANAKKVSTR